MPKLPDSLTRALGAGATVVTPNKRLARRLGSLYDDGERAAGRLAWPAAQVLPWKAWVGALWHDALAAGVVPASARLVTPVQASRVWNDVVAPDAEDLVDPGGAAALAADAWERVHAWGAGGESWRGFADAGSDDVARFVRWAERYARARADASQIDVAQLPDRLCGWATAMPSLRGASIVLAGFADLTPQQERLAAAVARAGASVTRVDPLPPEPGRVFRDQGRSPSDEIARALAWARARALAEPGASIGIAVRDLAERREEFRALAEDALCPGLQWPDALGEPRPYNLSLGAPLAEVPMIAIALGLLEWCAGELPVGRAAAVLRSPYVASLPDAWLARSTLERTWLEQGRRSVTMDSAIAGLRALDPAMSQRWAGARDRHPLPTRGSPREHAQAWRGRMAAMGWPGGRAQDSAEYQAERAWDGALAEFATLGRVEPRLARAEALAALRAQLEAAVFQPEAPPAPLQILGLLEAAGQPFDALWVAGLAAEHWPPAPRPHPLLPIGWQRDRGVPHSTAANELAWARAVVDQLARAAPEVVFSHSERADDHALSPSALLPAAPNLAGTDVSGSPGRAQFANRAPKDSIADEKLPRVTVDERVEGGAGLVEAQSDCPFKAAATYRLGVEPWPAPADGLSAMDRGRLVHRALAAFWSDVRTHAALSALSPGGLAARVAAAVEQAAAELGDARWKEIEPAVAAGERQRTERLLAGWLERCEKPRPAFAVRGCEVELAFALGPLALNLRIDRIDELDGGGVAIVDYKTGRAKGPRAWFEPRPRAIQLPLYAIAHRRVAPADAVRAISYAQLKPGELGVKGLAADERAWPGLDLPSEVRGGAVADWKAAEANWAAALAALGTEILAGSATVTPRDRSVCGYCGLHALCRIDALGSEGAEEGGDG